MGDSTRNEELERERLILCKDYEVEEGRHFEHFWCPILFRDEVAELCKGHIINQSVSGSTRLWVVQRKDVDNFFGRVFEGDMTAMMATRDLPLTDVLGNKNLAKRMSHGLRLGSDSVRFYYDRGGSVPAAHTPVELRSHNRVIPMVAVDPIVWTENGPSLATL